MLTLQTLGLPRLDGPDGELLHGRRKELALLAYLARRATAVSRETLADLLWDARPDTNARQSLRQAILHLNRALPNGVHAESDTVAVAADALELDVARFETDLAAGRLTEAVARWEGDFLAGYDDAGGHGFRLWLETERENLRTRLHGALATLADDADRRGDRPEVVRWAERWAEAAPFDERAATRLVSALLAAGRAEEARGRHAAFVARLRHELETTPSAAFAGLITDRAPLRPSGRSAPASGALLTPDLTGRRSALEALHRAWGAARAGTTTLVLVEGDEGIGKTRLCEEFLRTIPPEAVVLRARGSDARREAPFGAVHELLAGLRDAPGLAGAHGAALAAAGAAVPSIRERFPHAAGEGEPAALADAVADIFEAVASETPIFVVVDDYPLVDRESQDVLVTFARRVRHAAVCLVMVSRVSDTPSDLLAEVRGRAGEPHIRLAPLTELEVGTLLASMLEIAPTARVTLTARLYAESGGNPFNVIETTAALLDEGWMTLDAQGMWYPKDGLADGTLPVPPTLRDAAHRRYAALSPHARALADAAAVLGAPATIDRLALVAQLSDDDAAAATEELLLRRVLRASSGPGDRYELPHDVTRRAVLARLPQTRRRRLHARALSALRGAADTGDGTEIAPAQLDYHRRRAGRLGGRLPWISTGATLTGAALLVTLMVLWATRAQGGTGFAERDWVIVTDVANATGDSAFDRSLAAALMFSISQSRYVNVVSPARIRETLQRMRRDTVRYLNETVAREVALREGVRFVVALSIAGSGPRYALAARILEPEQGTTLAVVTAEAEGQDQVLFALDRIAVDVRRALGESATSIQRGTVPLPQATTSSLEALRQFATGTRAFEDGRLEDARNALEAAIALDSGFAWAHATLGRLQAWNNQPRAAEVHLAAALALTDRLPQRERLWIRRVIAQGRGDNAEAMRFAQEYVTEYPDDRDGWVVLARVQQEAGDRAGALTAFQRVLDIDPHESTSLINAAVLYDLTGRPREGLDALERAIADDSSLVTLIAGDLNRIYGFLLLRVGDSSGSRAVFERLLTGDQGRQANGLRSLGLLELYYGRYDAGIARLQQAVRINTASDAVISELRNRLYLAAAYRTVGDTAAARRQLDAVHRLEQRNPIPPAWLGFVGQQYARNGMIAAAALALDSIEARARSASTGDHAAAELVRGEIALVEGRFVEAAEALARAAARQATNYQHQGRARALAAAGDSVAAVAVYRAMLADSALGYEVQEPWILAHYELARLLDAQGDTAAALPLYRWLADLWEGGDPDIPILREVQRRLPRMD